MKVREWPEKDELVIATITALNPNSAFATLNEYDGKRAMIHVSEVATTWVRDIRKHLKVGQKIVAQVRYVDQPRDVINLSIKRVGAGQRREKLLTFENEKKATNLLSIAAKELSKSLEDAYNEVGYKMQEKFGTLYAGFEAAVAEGEVALTKAGVEEKWAKVLAEIAKKSIKPREVEIKAILELKCLKPNGVDVIKAALAAGKKAAQKGAEIAYISAPRYSLVVKGTDYPSCERNLEAVSKAILSEIETGGGEGQMMRQK